MIELTTIEVAELVGGRAVGSPVTIAAVGTDSRSMPARAMFVALRDDRDGHDFVEAAIAAGAVAVLVEREDAVPDGAAAVVVDDTWLAIRRLAGAVRTRVAPRVVGITGSVGKTTTKDLAAAACRTQRRTVAAVGSFNNELGVPLTLLQTEADTEVLVVEIGARGKGHIAELTPIVMPDVAIVTAVGGGAHLEQFGSLDGIAEAKGELVEGLRRGGVAVLNHDDDLVAGMAARAPGNVLTFSADGNTAASLHAIDVRLDGRARASFTAVTPSGRVRVQLPLAGRHQVGNALAALAAAISCGVELQAAADGLAQAQVSAWRSHVSDVRGIRLLNDAYNANPTSTVAALDALEAQDVTGRRWAVLGVMAELGPDHDEGHLRVGRRAAEVADVVLVVGEGAEGIANGAREVGGADVVEVDDVRAALTQLVAHSGDAVLVKASRVAGLERVATALAEGSVA